MAIIKAYAKSIYWHLQKGSIVVTASQKVKAGDLIALADNTGMSTGSHLHFGLKPVKKGEADWQWYNIEQTNGVNGAIDPLPYLPPINNFQTKLKLGDSGFEVEKIQAFLVRQGFLVMPPNTPFGFYGNLTRKAVLAFQLKYCDLTTHEKNILRGSLIGNKTLLAINNLHSKE